MAKPGPGTHKGKIPPDPLTFSAMERTQLVAYAQTAEAQRDDALRVLTSRANLQQTIEKVDQLCLSLERAVGALQRAGKVIVQLKLVSAYLEEEA